MSNERHCSFSYLDSNANVKSLGPKFYPQRIRLLDFEIFVVLDLIAHPHLLVRTTSKWFLPAGATFRDGLASESHWLQPMLVRTVHWWPALVSVCGLLV